MWICPVSVTSICLRLPVIKHVWFEAPCSEQVSVSTRVSNTFCGPGLCTSSVYSALSQTRLSLVSYLCKSLALCLKHVWIVDPCLLTSISLEPKWLWTELFTWIRRNFVFLHVMSGLDYEGGDGHKHGCLDALAIALSLRWSPQSRATSGYSCLFCITSMY